MVLVRKLYGLYEDEPFETHIKVTRARKVHDDILYLWR